MVKITFFIISSLNMIFYSLIIIHELDPIEQFKCSLTFQAKVVKVN